MIEELQKRPFARPLFLWIAGIVLQVCFPLQKWSVCLLIPVSAVLLFSFCFSGKNARPQYYARWLWGALFSCIVVFMSIQMTAYAEQRLYAPHESGWLEQQARAVQIRMAHRLDNLRLSDDEKSILATITISYRQTMSREVLRKFSTAGVAHILSVSGFHVGILYGFLSFLFSGFSKRRFLKWVRIVLLLLALWAFAFIAGLSVSTVRATLMSSIYLAGQAFLRRPERHNTLAATAFLLLVYNPFYLFDIGFQLSFLAVLFIFWLQRPLSRLIEVRNPLLSTPWDVLTITVAAQVGTTFLCCYYFGVVSTVFLMSNLILSLLATALIPLAVMWMILPDGMSWFGALQWAVEYLTHGFVWVVDGFGTLPGATLSLRFDFVSLVCAYAFLGCLLLFFRYRQGRMLFVSLSILLGMLCRQIFYSGM
ncbi:MAG: ComEC/Rec2 family competence protein [Tannerella sp.]|jgi:competence protein ComEC|nr:ComEC/Rec2 family competence protein [Tannerella sp.]